MVVTCKIVRQHGEQNKRPHNLYIDAWTDTRSKPLADKHSARPEKAKKPQQQYRETKVDLNDSNQQAAAACDTREQPRRELILVEKTVGHN